MSFSKIKFMGATVQSVSTSIGFGTQKSSLTVTLVEDPKDNDVFAPQPYASPALFKVGSFRFPGILQKWESSKSTTGNPIHTVIMEDPRDILDAAQVILSTYHGSVLGVPNLLNVFGYWEAKAGFGGSQINDAGMPWSLVSQGLFDLANGANPTYGHHLSFNGYAYALDLSELPIPPQYYRVGGTNISALQLIDDVIKDSGYDFHVELTEDLKTIKIRTINRRLQPPLGTISKMILDATASGKVVKGSAGLEVRNEENSVFIVGSEQTQVYEAQPQSITPFWGLDEHGTIIIGNSDNLTYDHTMVLNCSEIQDILGGTRYPCTVLELSVALIGYDNWLFFMEANRPDVAKLALLCSPNLAVPDMILNGKQVFNNNAPAAPAHVFPQGAANKPAGQNVAQNAVVPAKPPINAQPGVIGAPGVANKPVMNKDLINLNALNIKLTQDAIMQKKRELNAKRFYSFVQKIASEYLGKKWVVRIPFVEFKQDPESTKIIFSQEPTDAAYFKEGSSPLGIEKTLQIKFQSSDGRFNSFVKYEVDNQVNWARLANSEYVIGATGLYVKSAVSTEVQPPIMFLDKAPVIILIINNPIYRSPTDATGAGLDIVAAAFHMTPKDFLAYCQKCPNNFLPRIYPLPYQPLLAAIPFKSNILTYGPWGGIGADGKVHFEVNNNLAPWNYGGYGVMNAAATALVNGGITRQQVQESGSYEEPDIPRASLGDVLADGGPNITDMNIAYGVQGFTTTYRFQTFTQKYGLFAKQNAERLRRLGQQAQDMAYKVKQALDKFLSPANNSDRNSIAGLYQGIGEATGRLPAGNAGSPHDMLYGRIDVAGEDPALRRTDILTCESKNELGALIHSNDNTAYVQEGAMSLDGLLRPFSTNPDDDFLAHYRKPNGFMYKKATLDTLNPFQSGTDIDTFTYGNTYNDAHAYLMSLVEPELVESDKIRALALKGPLLIEGWGIDVNGNPVPSDGKLYPDAGQQLTLARYPTGWLRKSHLWEVGPLDPLWDKNRGVWTVHDLCMGVLRTDLREWMATGAGPNGDAVAINSGTMNLYHTAFNNKVGVTPIDIDFTGGRHSPKVDIIGDDKNHIERRVYNFFSTSVPSGTRIIAGWIPEATSWWVVSTDCV